MSTNKDRITSLERLCQSFAARLAVLEAKERDRGVDVTAKKPVPAPTIARPLPPKP